MMQLWCVRNITLITPSFPSYGGQSSCASEKKTSGAEKLLGIPEGSQVKA